MEQVPSYIDLDFKTDPYMYNVLLDNYYIAI